MQRNTFLVRFWITAGITLAIVVTLGCENPAATSEASSAGSGELTVDGVGSFPLSHLYFEASGEPDSYTVLITLSAEPMDEFDVVPDGVAHVWLELRSETWPLAAGTYGYESDSGVSGPSSVTFEGDVDWGDDWDEIASGTVTVSEDAGQYTISGNFDGGSGSSGTFSMSASPTILDEPDADDTDPDELGVNVAYEATVSGAITGSFSGSAGLQENYNVMDDVYRFVFGVDDLTSQPPTSLSWTFVVDTYHSANDGLIATTYPIGGEVGGHLQTDVAVLYETTYVLLYIDDTIYRFAGTADSPGNLTLATVTASLVEGSFSLTGPFEVSSGSSWDSAGEATLETSFIIDR